MVEGEVRKTLESKLEENCNKNSYEYAKYSNIHYLPVPSFVFLSSTLLVI